MKTITKSADQALLIGKPPGFNSPAPSIIRRRNVSPTGFDFKNTERDYQNGVLQAETTTYTVMEQGYIILPDGSRVEAGTFQGTTSFATIKFSKSFAKAPVILTTIAFANGADTISGRHNNIGLSGFAYYFREQEKNVNTHSKETMNFIAWQPGKGTIGSVQYKAATTAKAVTQAWYAPAFKQAFKQPPMLLADQQTTSNTDTSALRVQNITTTGFQVKVEEEKSKDTELAHPAEAVGYLVIDKAE